MLLSFQSINEGTDISGFLITAVHTAHSTLFATWSGQIIGERARHVGVRLPSLQVWNVPHVSDLRRGYVKDLPSNRRLTEQVVSDREVTIVPKLLCAFELTSWRSLTGSFLSLRVLRALRTSLDVSSSDDSSITSWGPVIIGRFLFLPVIADRLADTDKALWERVAGIVDNHISHFQFT